MNLNVAVLDQASNASLYTVEGTGLLTFKRDYAESHRRAGSAVREEHVRITTLATICAKHVNGHAIDFLKIDNAGTELQVLQRGDWTRFRLQVVLIEATLPSSQTLAYADAERFPLAHDCLFAYFDGPSRFYVAKEESDLLKCFATPPNIFDAFVTRRTALAACVPPWQKRQVRRILQFEITPLLRWLIQAFAPRASW